MGTDDKKIFESASEISSNHRCGNCGIMMDQVQWLRCRDCKQFHLCKLCKEIGHDNFPASTSHKHLQLHQQLNLPKTSITGELFGEVCFGDVEDDEYETRRTRRAREYQRILQQGTISNDYEMFTVMKTLYRQPPTDDNGISSLVVKYHLTANERRINILSLDGGGVRGYMPIKILTELITQKYLPDMLDFDADNKKHQEMFYGVQSEFTKNFDYFVGTSTGGLIAFCLATNYNILYLMEIYSKAGDYFKRNRLGPWIYSKYDPSVIHKKIDEIIGKTKFAGGKQISAENATLLDVRNLLNPDNIINEEDVPSKAEEYGYLLQFDDSNKDHHVNGNHNGAKDLCHTPREKVLLIPAYNATKNSVTIFNTSYAKHWGYRIADVLKCTMAAPTYFPPHEVPEVELKEGVFIRGSKCNSFIDGGVFANDPDLAALWVVRMQWKKPTNYHLLSIGTGTYTTSLSTMRGGYVDWILHNGILVNTLMDATRSFTEVITGNLAKFNNMRRMKLNYKITEAMDLDDPDFVGKFDREWERLKNEPDYRVLLYFYENYIVREAQCEKC